MGSGWTISQMESGFIASDEYYARAGSTPAGWVTSCMPTCWGAPRASSEVAFWTGQLAGGVPRSQVAMGFLLSTERLSTVVDGYYQHLLGRSPDAPGRGHWVGILQAGGRNEAIIGGIIASDEYWIKTVTTAYTWGYNAYGQLGDGAATEGRLRCRWLPRPTGPRCRPARLHRGGQVRRDPVGLGLQLGRPAR